MKFFDPDDSYDQPHAGMGYFIFGSASIGWTYHCITSNLWICLVVGCIIFGVWKAYRRWFNDKTRSDFTTDVVYWLFGVLVWTLFISYEAVIDVGVMYPTLPLCVWVIQYVKLKADDDERIS